MNREIYKRVAPHLDRTKQDGGVPTDNMSDLFLLQRSNEQYKDYLKLSFCPELHGYKKDTRSGINYVTKGYSLLSNDLTQISSANQPYLDKIAPNEKLSAKNPNGGGNYLTHQSISFGASDEWTIEVVSNHNFSGNQWITEGNQSLLGIFLNTPNFSIRNDSGILSKGTYDTSSLSGKTSIIHFVAKGNSTLLCYANGLLKDSINIATNMVLSRLISLSFAPVNCFKGSIFSHHIFSKALSASEIAERSSILRSIFPEIPFTRIGDQIWSVRNFEATVTPQGNLIPEVQSNGNVEKITNGNFDSSSNWKFESGYSVSGGLCIATNANGMVYQNTGTANKWYKITFTIVSISNGAFRARAGNYFGTAKTNIGTYTEYIKATDYGVLGVHADAGSNGSLDNISIQEIGWSGSQELYTGIFNQRKTLGDTDEQATYAAVKAAAMWCHYGNDSALGAVYGKLYNWFAVKLLQMDIDYYNANNPTTPWGWRVPTQSDFNTLATTLGGAAVAGGKMKTVGTTYWNSPNTGANNSSGFSAIGNGFRIYSSGSYNSLQNDSWTWLIDMNGYNTPFNNSNCNISNFSGSSQLGYGFSLRLIKT